MNSNNTINNNDFIQIYLYIIIYYNYIKLDSKNKEMDLNRGISINKKWKSKTKISGIHTN